jgi:putative DNA primase/helicase
MLAEEVRSPLIDIAWRMKVALDFVAVCFIVFLTGCLQRRARMRPRVKEDEDWEEVFNLGGGIVARSGMKKSPVMRRIAQWIYTIQEAADAAHAGQMKQYELDSEIHEIQLNTWRTEVRNAIQEQGVLPARPDDPTPPSRPIRIILNDTTVPAAQEVLIDNPAGIILLRDELGGWWINLDRHEENRDFYMTGYSGNVPYDVDRIKRGHRRLKGLSLGMFGATTPDGLRAYVADAVKHHRIENGFLQRYQLLVWPDLQMRPQARNFVKRVPGEEFHNVQEMFNRAVRIDPEAPLRYQFTDRAQERFDSWEEENSRKVYETDTDSPMGSHLAKYPKLVSVLAASFAFMKGEEEFFDLPELELAIRWAQYLETHANRIYSCVTSVVVDAARRLAEKIKSKRIGEGGVIRTREVYVHGWKGLDDPESARKALHILENHNWIRRLEPESGPQGGNPGEQWQINPRIWENARKTP